MRRSTLFAVLVVPLLLCALIAVVLADEGPVKALPHSVRRAGLSARGEVSDSLAPQGYVYFCNSPGVGIPDADSTGITNTAATAQTFTVNDLNIYISTTHSYVGDLIYTLEHVDTGTSVTIIDRPGVPATPFGCAGNNIDATLDDEAGLPVEDECAGTVPAISGNFYPNNPLSAFNGESVTGDWQLTVSDNAGGDTGTLDAWCVEATDCVQIAWANFIFAPSAPQVGEMVSFTTFAGPNDATGPIDYIWDFGDGFGDVGPFPSHAYDTAQTFTITLTVQNPCNSLNVEKQITVSRRIYLPLILQGW